MRTRLSVLACSAALLLLLGGCGWRMGTKSTEPPIPTQGEQKPNILVVIADDMGYSDIAPFGSEISTPNLQRLANRGARFTNFRVHTMCTPTRAMLLTGVNNHIAGIGTMAGEWRGQQKDLIGYEA